MKTLMFAACLFSAMQLFSQGKTLSGVVMEENKKGRFNPIHLANVFWLGTTTGTTTDSNGVFNLPFSEGNERLVISYLGYRPDTITIKQPDKITVVLKDARNLKEVTVEYRTKSTAISAINPIKVQQIGQKELFKAACCNLSESFETNPSVDVAFTDAVTGTRQIQLLGLAGSYTQINQENVPAVRGLATNYGLEFIPGTWIESMQLSKGTGSVINGYESIAGQLNIELHKPFEKNRLIVNGYASQGGRYESNVVVNKRLTPELTTGILMHGSYRPSATDQNNDGFMDNPLGRQYSFMNRWDYRTDGGFESQLYFRHTSVNKDGGHIGAAEPGTKDSLMEKSLYLFEVTNTLYEVAGKAGYVFPNRKYQSMGMQLSYRKFESSSAYGVFNAYHGSEQTLYANLIYQGIIGTSDHKFRTGFSFLKDDYDEAFNSLRFNRSEIVPGIFGEYTWTASDRFSMIAGLRADRHNLFGSFVTPRLHLRYAPAEKTVFRLSAGRGQKTANILAENSGFMASSRAFVFPVNSNVHAYGLKPEVAWNMGLNFTRHFTIDYREGYFTVDLYRTDFQNQVVADLDATAREVRFYNLNGRSYSNSFQAELNYELLKHFDVRLAYRYYDVKTQYSTGLLSRPLVSRHRAFVNMGYETVNGWTLDYTVNWVGKKRLPSTAENPEPYRLESYSPHYFLMNAQVTKKAGERFEAYIGVENITNFRQNNAIVAANDPYGPYFDSSMIWGPVFGRMFYLGFRYTIRQLGETK